MTSSIFWRLAWKEYRQQRDLIVAIAIITVVILGIMLAWSWLENRDLSPGTAFHVALMMPVFYALGCGATLFAGEHERETFGFLRGLPLRSSAAFWPKFAVSVVSTLALTAALVLLAGLFTRGRYAVEPGDALLLAYYFLIMGEVLVWTVLFSQLLKHPAWAIVAGGLAYFAALVAVMAVVSVVLPGQNIHFSVFTVVRCVLLTVLTVVNIGLGARWLERERTVAAPLEGPAATDLAPAQGPASQFTMFGRLWWQSLRESGWIVAAIYGALAMLTVLVLFERQGPAGLVWLALPALIGSFTFFQDHWKQHYRFFSEQGVAPRTLWWARILAGLAACLPWLAVMMIAAALPRGAYEGNFRMGGQAGLFDGPATLLGLGALLFAWGQWSSLLFRAGIVGLFVGVAASAFLMFAVGTLRFLGIPDWLGVWLPVGVLLWASWWRAPDWLAERNSWRRWFAYAATLAVPLVLYLAGIIAHRAYEIPQLVDTSSMVSGPAGVMIPQSIATQHRAALAELMRPATTEELETAQLYRALWNEIRQLPPLERGAMMGGAGMMSGSSMGGPAGAAGRPGLDNGEALGELNGELIDDEQWKKERAEKLAALVERFVEISRRPNADFVPEPLDYLRPEEARMVADFEAAVLEDARRLDDEKAHDQSLERHLALIRFARHYQHRGDFERVTTSMALVGRVHDRLLARAGRIDQSQESLLALRDTLNSPPYHYLPDYDLVWIREYVLQRAIVDLHPAAWEVLHWSPARELNRTLLSYLPWERTRTRRWFDYQAVAGGGMNHDSSSQGSRWPVNTVLGDLWLPTPELIRARRLQQDTQQSAMQLRLLLLAWKAEHGELPDSLEALEQAFPGKVPLDPATQRPWVYRPHGSTAHEKLRRPFIWSAGSWAGSDWTVYSLANDADLARYGEVFVIEPEAENH